jgi:hypothetical protein
MSHYCNIYRAAPGIVKFEVYNLLSHIDGHVRVWLRVCDLKWCWSKTGGYANLVSIAPVDEMAPVLPSAEDAAVLGPAVKKLVAGTFDPETQRFILPEDNARAAEHQQEFDESPPDSWMREHLKTGGWNPHDIIPTWGWYKVRTGCPVLEVHAIPDEVDERLDRQAEELLNQQPIDK